MKKEDQLIMAVKKDLLFKGDHFEGFKERGELDLQKRILENFEYLRRGDAEEDDNYKQPIGYAVLMDPEGKVFAYKRATKKRDYTEKRLRGKWSWGVGGHVDKPDEESDNPLKESVLRELGEEVFIDGEIRDPEVLGYINDESNSVGRVHLGVLYLVRFSGEIRPGEAEIEKGEMMNLSEIEGLCEKGDHEIEEWSKIAIHTLKKMK